MQTGTVSGAELRERELASRPEGSLEVRGVSKRFGGLLAVDEVSFAARPGEVTAVIGPNGAGKSTLMNLASGFISPDRGRVLLSGEEVTFVPPWTRVELGMSRTFQDLEVFEDLTVGENVALGFPAPLGGSPLRSLLRWRRATAEYRDIQLRTLDLLAEVGLADAADDPASSLSYGDQKLLIVARLIATGCDVLLFDEPGAGLSKSSLNLIGGLLRQLSAQGKTIVLVDHNMHLIFGYADYVYVIHHGQLVAEGTPAEIQSNDEVIRIYLAGGGKEDA